MPNQKCNFATAEGRDQAAGGVSKLEFMTEDRTTGGGSVLEHGTLQYERALFIRIYSARDYFYKDCTYIEAICITSTRILFTVYYFRSRSILHNFSGRTY